MPATVGNRSAAEGTLLEQPRCRPTPPGSADSLLTGSHVEITYTGDFDFKDHNDGSHFLECEIDSRVVARTYLERKNKVALQVKCSWKRNKPKVNTVHRALLQSILLEPAVVKSVRRSTCTCRRNFPAFFFSFFLFLVALLANFLSAFTQQLLPLPLRFSWEWSGPNFFLGW